MIEAAPAKINLALHVTGRRTDGYHLLDSLVAFAACGDVVRLSDGPLSLTIDGPFADGLDAGDGNLCLRAARLAGAEVAIRLTKNLPVASGIGGGSSDAAAVLRGLHRRGHPLPEGVETLGADVPVCLAGRPARMRGAGERLDPVPPLPPLPMVLVNPGAALSTPQVFAALDRTDHDPLPCPQWSDAETLLGWLSRTRNDLQPAAGRLVPEIGTVLAALEAQGARLARMSGSGATCFGLFDHPDQARQAAAALSPRGWWAVPTELAPDPVPV